MLRRLLILTSVFLLYACGGDLPVEDQIAERLRAMADFAEAGEVRKASGFIGATYSDLRGNDKRTVVNLFRAMRLTTDKLAIFLDIDNISLITASLAEADVRVRFAGFESSRFALKGASYRFILELELQRGDWLIVAARWARGDGEPR